jgi:hypothetical protein
MNATAKLVFLGGTAGGNSWRDVLIEALTARGVDPQCLFNPVVADWNPEAQAREEDAKAKASQLVYYVADPQQEGNPLSAYSMVEATMALYDNPENTVVVFDPDGMSGHPLKAMKQALKVLKTRFPEANIFGSRDEIVDWLTKELK